MLLGVTARVLRGCWCLVLAQPLLDGCRSDDSRNKSVGVPGTLPAATTELPTDEATPSKANTAAREADSARRAASADGGLITLTPTAMREDTRLPSDSPNPKDSTGVTLEAEWKPGDWPSLPNNSPIERERLSDIHSKSKWLLRIDLVASGRMRITLASRGYAFEKGTEVRSRVDLLGHLLVWPEENQYRILPPGSMRSLFEDGLPDVGPTLATNAKTGGTARWLDWDTERTSVTNSLGHAILDQTTATNAGVAGRLLCRWLIEFINADPASSVCQNDLVPVRAQFNFAGGGKAEFVVTQSTKKQEYTASSVGVPPLGAVLNARDLPRAAAAKNLFLVDPRSRTVARPPSAGSTTPNGIVAVNHTLGLRVLVVDGIAAAWLLPGEQRDIPELLPGAYFIAWRDFLGNSVEAPKSVTAPARVSVGTSP